MMGAAASHPRASAGMTARGCGLGLRPPHFARAATGEYAGVDWFEVITENFLVEGGNPRRALREARAHRPIALHGVSLSIASIDPIDEAYLARVKTLADEIEPAAISDHLCWTSLGGHQTHDLLPVPYTEEALAHVVARVVCVQERLGRQILLENPSTYAQFAASTIDEAAFLAELARRADCGILLDINNIYVSAQNHGWDAGGYLDAIPAERVGYLHVAGHTHDGPLLIDTHDQPVCDAVWALHRAALARFPGVPTLLERDDHLPDFDELVAELQRARSI